MNDVERWINLEGPEPEGIREMLDAARAAAREVPELPPELEAELHRSLAVALAAPRRGWARQRRINVAVCAGVLAACAAGTLVLALRWGAPLHPSLAPETAPNALGLAPAMRADTARTAPPPATPRLPARR